MNSTLAVSQYTFKPAEADWRRIEQAYQVELSDGQRASISKIVSVFLRNEPQEKSAPFVDDVLKDLEHSKRTVEAFLKWLEARQKHTMQTNEIICSNMVALCHNFVAARSSSDNPFRRLAFILTALLATHDRTEQEVRAQTLRRLCRRHRLEVDDYRPYRVR